MTKIRSTWVIGMIIVLIVLLSLFQTVAFYRRTPMGATYPLVHGYAPDYYWYLSLMHQGWEGRFLVTTRYTPEHFAPQLVNTFFPFAGFVAHIVGVSLPVMYLLLRFVFGISLLLSGYYLATRLSKSSVFRWLSICLMIAGVPLWFWDGGILRTYGDFWAELDPIVRLSYLPHHMAANVAMILSFLFYFYTFQYKKIWFALYSGLAALIATWLNPASFLPIVGAFGLSMILKPRSVVQNPANHALVLGLTGVPIIVLLRIEHSVFPWTAFRDWEQFISYPIDATVFLKVLGIAAIPAILAVPQVLSKKNTLWMLVVGWFATPLIGLGLIEQFLPISNARYLQSASYIPTALLAASGLEAFILWMTKRWFLKTVITVVILLMFFAVSIPSFQASVSQQMRSVERDYRSLLYSVPDGVVEAMSFLEKNGSAEDVVAAPGWVSTMIPAFTDKRTLVGHPTFTDNGWEKQNDLDRLFQMSDRIEGEEIVQKYGVAYLWSESSSEISRIFIQSMGFVPVFSNSAATIYQGER